MSSRGKGIKAAIRLYQRECAAEKLPLECAIAQLLKHVVNLVEAFEDDSHQRIVSAVGSIRYEFHHVRKCFRAEYPTGIDWRDHEQGAETPDSKAATARLNEAADREDDRPPQGIVWSDWKHPLQETAIATSARVAQLAEASDLKSDSVGSNPTAGTITG